MKRPSLLYYGDTAASTELGALTLREAEVCEILRASSHPNIVQYLGCVVETGRITGFCFVKYDMTLSQRVAQASRPFNAGSFLQYIEEGIRHLHSLELIHCDLNPTNILMRGEIPARSTSSCWPRATLGNTWRDSAFGVGGVWKARRVVGCGDAR